MTFSRISLSLCLAVLTLSANAATTKTELAGNSLAQYPFFEYVRAFNANAPVRVAIDPTRFPAIAGDTCGIFVVNHKSPSDWSSNPALVDVTPGGAQTETFSGPDIQGNTFQVAGPTELSANAGLGLGVAYDVVFDCDMNNALSDGDFIDGLGSEAGLYVVHDTTLAGPEAVTEQVYNLTSPVAATFGIPDWKRGQDLYFPTNIAAINTNDFGSPAPRAVTAGPGQKPASPQPNPNAMLPHTRRLSILFAVGKSIGAPQAD